MDADIARNAELFRNSISGTIAANITLVVGKNANKLDEAYSRLAGMQAIKMALLNNQISEGAMGFFTEAQGDGLTSQILIMSGSSRSALKSLRSLIENVIRSIYYSDHSIEYRMWEVGTHRPTFKSFFEYIGSHPDITNVDAALNPSTSLYSNWKKTFPISACVCKRRAHEQRSG